MSDADASTSPGSAAASALALVDELGIDLWQYAGEKLGDPSSAAIASHLAWLRYARNAHFGRVDRPDEWLHRVVDHEAVRLARLGRHGSATPGADVEPDQVLSMARAAVAAQQVPAKFARISYDSVEPAARGVFLPLRGNGDTRMVSFEAGSLLIDLSIEAGEAGATAHGVLMPPSPAVSSVGVIQPASSWDVEVRSDGAFTATGLLLGPLSLQILEPTPIVTDWIAI